MTLDDARRKVSDYFGAYFEYYCDGGKDGYLVHRGVSGQILTAIIVSQRGDGWRICGIAEKFVCNRCWNDLMSLNR